MQSEAEKEKLKLTANLCNNLAVAVISLGVIGPFFQNLLTGLSKSEIGLYIIGIVAVASMFHMLGYWYLSDLEG